MPYLENERLKHYTNYRYLHNEQGQIYISVGNKTHEELADELDWHGTVVDAGYLMLQEQEQKDQISVQSGSVTLGLDPEDEKVKTTCAIIEGLTGIPTIWR